MEASVIVVVCVAAAALAGRLTGAFSRIPPEIRVPRAPALPRLSPAALRALRSSPVRLRAQVRLHRRPGQSQSSGPPEDGDVELAVRERLYGASRRG